MSRGDRHIDLQRAHQKYGDIVRTSPDSLSFRSPTAVHDIYNRKANVIKAGWVDVGRAINAVHNTHSIADRDLHSRRRRLLAFAFSEQALRNLESFVTDNIQIWLSYMSEPKTTTKDSKENDWSKPHDIGIWSTNLTLDVLGDLCFGASFNAMQTGRHFIPRLLLASSFVQQCLASLPFRRLLYPLLYTDSLLNRYGPKIFRDKNAFRATMKPLLQSRFAKEAEDEGKDEGEKRRDFMHYLMKARDPETGEKFAPADLVGEAALLVGAGSDTSATTLSALFFYLTREANVDVLERLQEEVRGKFADVEEIVSGKDLTECHWLRACIDESLRMTPSVPGLLPRRVLKGGHEVAGELFPEDTLVGSAAYTVHHNERVWKEADRWVPGRWIEGEVVGGATVTSEMVEEQKLAFIPFSTGPRNCVGKNLAMMEMMLCVARSMWMFDIRGLKGDRSGYGENWGRVMKVKGEEEYQTRDWFVSDREGPSIEFRKRTGIPA